MGTWCSLKCELLIVQVGKWEIKSSMSCLNGMWPLHSCKYEASRGVVKHLNEGKTFTMIITDIEVRVEDRRQEVLILFH